MTPRRNKEKFQQPSEFEQGRIIDLREGGFSYRAIEARVQRNSSTVIRYAGERCLPECVIERHGRLTTGVMVWGAILYHGRSNLLRIEGNFNRNRYASEMQQTEVVPFLQGIPEAIFH
ncbi:transposable element Tc1 transposase [Trichonephila clavipes]|uniref:Transposable element Tc1 transposase n=1 Tax=Trichonephila clavipes TaxID=2585209 RepID=A0A8X6RAD6_TRICX|nr:transposable element Tc1 transposase [Trichonephila clavipes]